MTASKLLEDLEAHLSKPEDYINPSSELKSRCLAGLKTAFHLLQKRCRESAAAGDAAAAAKSGGKGGERKRASVPTGPLSELYVEGFDVDQIWEQVELVNGPLIAHVTKQVERMSQWDLDKLTGGDGVHSSSKEETTVSDSGSDGMGEWESDVNNAEDEYFDDGEESESACGDGERGETEGRRRRVVGRRSVVDDRFFKLAEMEAFLEKMEKEQDHQRRPEDSDLDSDLESDEERVDKGESDVDYFMDVPSDSELGGSAEGTKRALYDDFFDAPEDEEEVKGDETRSSRQAKKRGGEEGVAREREERDRDSDGEGEEMSELEEEEEEGQGYDDGDFSDMEEEEKELGSEATGEMRGELFEERASQPDKGEEEGNQHKMSTHERMQLKINERISSLEEANLEQKSWQLGGEATAKSRPENSLLEEDLSFEHMTRPAPVVTEETTKTLEDIIKQRITDEAWDDVERRVKPKEKPYDYSRTRPLDQEKSKLSLAEVYEQEYIKQTQAFEEVKEDERHTVIKEIMTKLFVKLDALSNFHFTPKPPKPEVKIVANVPAIQMEEVAPVTTSDAALLAPEEIQVKSKAPEVGDSEKTSTNRKRERRLKKKRKRLRLAEKRQKEKLVSKLRPGLGNKYTKKSFTKKLEEREEEERVDKSLKSSSQFFARLQEQVREQVKGVKAEESRTKKGRTTRSQQYKL